LGLSSYFLKTGCKYRYNLLFSKSKYSVGFGGLPRRHRAVGSRHPSRTFPLRAPTMPPSLPVRQAGLAKSLTIQSFRSPKSQILLKS
jgi:hypothetical protein